MKGFAQRTYSANVAARNDAGTADKRGADVGNDSTVQVRHHHDIELARLRNKLHRTRRTQPGLKRNRLSTYVLSTIMSL